MADDGSDQGPIWPLPRFYFLVEGESFGRVMFQEVSGLDTDARPIEYRSDNGPVFSTIKMPGLVKGGAVTLKNGVFERNNVFLDWFKSARMNLIKRETVTIKLLDETGRPTMTWSLHNAFPTKVTGTDMKSEGSEVAVESIELAHEGLTIENT